MTRVTFVSKTEITPAVWEFVFVSEKPTEYVPGQYARFLFPFQIEDARGSQERTFTLTSHPAETELRFITRLETPMSAYKSLLLALRPGNVMHIDEPHGDAILPRQTSTPLIFAAQGIAIASYVSMLYECQRSKLPHPITLLWTRRESDDSLKTLLPEGGVNLTRKDSRPNQPITASDILTRISTASFVYLSGSQRFVEALGADLETQGILRERIIYDYYDGYLDL